MQALLLLLSVIPLVSADDEITEIVLSRSHVYGSGPVDKVVLHSDGTAAYTGTANVEDLGRFKGTFEDEDFKKLANLLVEKKFFEMKDRYYSDVTDQQSRFTQVTRAGQKKSVDNYGKAAPKEMQEIEDAIIKIMKKIDWRPDPAPPPEDER